MSIKQNGGIVGPNKEITHYTISAHCGDVVITFGSPERPDCYPMLVSDLLNQLHVHYDIKEPENGWQKEFSQSEKTKLRPIAETLAMLAGNAFFSMKADGDRDWWEQYLPEAAALYESNGGDNGWAGEASFIKERASKN